MAKTARKFSEINSTLLQAGEEGKVGAVRVEEGVARDAKTGEVLKAQFATEPDPANKGQLRWKLDREGNRIVTRPEQRAWKVYHFVELSDEEKKQFTALVGERAGEVLKTHDWKFISEHPTQEEALEVAGKLE